jgi:hypothetical protein
MRTVRTLIFAVLPIVAMTVQVAPAVSDTQSCGLGHAVDPGLRAAFAEFDRNQSRTAAKLCAFYLNSNTALLDR